VLVVGVVGVVAMTRLRQLPLLVVQVVVVDTPKHLLQTSQHYLQQCTELLVLGVLAG
jgi:hypothetical protein